MTVGELRAKLAEFPDHYEVILPGHWSDGDDERAGSVLATTNTADGHGLAVMLSW